MSKKDLRELVPEIVANDIYQELEQEVNDVFLPDMQFTDATLEDVENHYKRVLTNGAVYFIGFDVEPEPSASEDAAPVVVEPIKLTFFVTGKLKDQLTTVALKYGGKLYQLNDDFYIVRSGDENLLSTFETSSVFVSTFDAEQIQKLLSLYKLTGQSFGLQTIARGSLLDLVEFSKAFKLLNQNKSVYLIDLAFIDFTIDEASRFEAFLDVRPLDILSVPNFSDIFAVYLDCSVDNLRSRNFYSQSLLASDGLKSTFNVGVTHSREERAITDQGTSTVSKYDDVKDGFQLTFTPKNTVGENVVCSLTLENSAFTDDSYTTKSETNLDLESVPFKLGKTYYVSSLTNVSKKRNLTLLGLELSSGHRVQTCWCRVRKIK